MKKLICALMCLIITCGIFTACSKEEAKPEIKIGQSKIFSESEIESAVNTVLKEKSKNSDSGIEKFITMTYDEKKSENLVDEFKVTYKTDEKNLIILFSSFKTKSDAAAQGFNENDTYDDFMWILTRQNEKANWKIVDCGY